MTTIKPAAAFVLLIMFLAARPAPAFSVSEGEYDGLDRQVLEDFLRLADLAATALELPPTNNDNYNDSDSRRAYPQFFVDSYAVRALAVANDLTGRERYSRALRTWTGRMLDYQDRMVPAGAYYMNYHRRPGETTGQWFVADCGSIAMGVLAAALRCGNDELRERYLQSCREFADLVLENYVRPGGGVTDGFWDKSDDEWWCSTALVTALWFQLYGVGGQPRYLEAAFGGLDWLLDFDYDRTILYDFEQGAPTTVFYVLEACASALPYLRMGGNRQKRVMERLAASVEWMADTQLPSGTWDYNPDNWGVKLGGLPCHMLIYLDHACDDPGSVGSRIAPGGRLVSFCELIKASAERALAHFSSRDSADSSEAGKFTQQDAFTMMSYAERLCPGELYRKRDSDFPFQRIESE